MKKYILLFAIAVAVISLSWTQQRPQQNGSPPAAAPFSFKITFGELRDRAADYSGSVTLSQGKVLGVSPWRFFGGDTVDGTNAWKLHIKKAQIEAQPDVPQPLATPAPLRGYITAGVIVHVDAPAGATAHIATAQGSIDVALGLIRTDRTLSFMNGDVRVQPVPSTTQISDGPEEHDYPSLAVTGKGIVWVAWQAYQDLGDHVFARYSSGAGWSSPMRLTDEKGDVFHTEIAEDKSGRVWVVWSQRSGEDWDLYARAYDGRNWDARRKLTTGRNPNMFHRLIADGEGNLHLVWIGWEKGESELLSSRLENGKLSDPVNVSEGNAWMPDAAADSQGNLWVAWDSYRAGNYDIFLRRVAADGTLGPIQQITKSPRFQAHASVAVDKQDRVWLAWDESGSNWGKDWNRDDQWRSTTLYADRHPRIAVIENGVLKEPAADVTAAIPPRYNRYIENPHLTVDGDGRVWLALQIRTATGSNRVDFWASGGHWEHFLTSYEGDRWTPATMVPDSYSRPDGIFRIASAAQGIWMAWVNDNRLFAAPKMHNVIEAAPFAASAPPVTAALEPYVETPGTAAPGHLHEAQDVAQIRGYRATVAGQTYRILRGDFHRHTEISADGAGDGSVEDYFRYMLDAAAMDTGIISDHNAGADNEYTWWRTEKAIDLFHIRGRYTPLFGYERSVNYPNGHRNVVFAERGTRTLPVRPEENQGKVNSGPILYPYLRQHRGIAMLHSLATGQGSDYRDNDPEVEPLVEIYQGYHAAYEYEGGPRAETDAYQVIVHGSYQPKGFYWNALAKGYKLGVESSSDHISTHSSYTMIYTPSVNRTDIVESMRQRHAYGATDNIVLDFRAVDPSGTTHMMGDIFDASTAPKFQVKVMGTAPIDRVEVIKDGKFVFETSDSEFTYVDANPEKKESWYYVRVMQRDRNMAWSSPVWIRYR
jgi:hypothetical protein